MTLAVVYSRASAGIDAPLVTVEIHLANGMAGFHIVGLPETAVKESRDRVRSALLNTNFDFPVKHIVVNLAPADLPKEGGRFDLPIAIGILAASAQLPLEIIQQYEFIGELALSGELRAVRGVLPIVLAAHQNKRKLIVPMANAEEAGLAGYENVFAANHLLEVCAHLRDEWKLPRCDFTPSNDNATSVLDLADVKGQLHAKRALQIAAAGNHSLLLVGPPGTGKTMLASRITTILPALSERQAMEVAAITSVSSNGFTPDKWKKRPFRAPHHTSSSFALVGGGRPPRPGEISLAHHGILFLDELPEFNRHVLECLREPLEAGCVTISRAAYQMKFPAKFQLIAAMNPCPCGYSGSVADNCQCSVEQVKRYLSKISGPLLDRIDMHVEVARVCPDVLNESINNSVPTSADIKELVAAAMDRQWQRQMKYNSQLSSSELDNASDLSVDAAKLLHQIMTKFNLSARVYHRIIKVARTIADFEAKQCIEKSHIGEAMQFRMLDRIKAQY